MKLKLIQKIAFLLIILYTTHINAQQMGSLKFNGDDNFVEIKNSPLNLIGNGDFTLEAWIKGSESEQTAHPMILSNRGESASGGGILFFFHNQWGESQHKMLCLQIRGNNHFFVNNGSYNETLLDNKCHHVAISRSGNTLSFYADGILFGTTATTQSATASLHQSILIGKDLSTNNTFNGLISQCRIWNIARTQTEIFENKDVSLQGTENGLLAYWEMKEENGQALTDKTGQYDGILGSDSGIDNQDPAWSTDGCLENNPTSTTNLEVPSFKMYPNPTSDFLTIQYYNSENGQLSLIDQTGRMLLSRTINYGYNEIDLTSIPKGIYFIKITNQYLYHTKKVTIQ